MLWRTVVPVSRPTLGVLLVFFFIWTWNGFLLPLVMLISNDNHNYSTHLYNRTVFDVLRKHHGEQETVVFARSATAGSQRFPVHWGGDCESTYEAMAESLRGGLSLGLSGFGFWSHDIGGFEGTPTPALFKRWIAFGLLSSHSRLHGSSSYRVPEGTWTHFLSGRTVTGPRWVRERHGFSSVPLLVRPGAVIPVGAVDDRPDYAYADGVTLRAYGLERGAEVAVPVGEVTFTVVREGDTLRASCGDPSAPWGPATGEREVRARTGSGFLTVELG